MFFDMSPNFISFSNMTWRTYNILLDDCVKLFYIGRSPLNSSKYIRQLVYYMGPMKWQSGRFLIPPSMYLCHPIESKKSSVNVNRNFFSLNLSKIYTKKKFGLCLPNFFCLLLKCKSKYRFIVSTGTDAISIPFNN
jgi:hypothetical protein